MTNETRIILPDFEKYKENYNCRNRTGLAPQTRALAFCMDAAGIKKLATREDMHELIVRMVFIFKPMRIVETYLLKGYFFYFKLPGRKTFFIPDDLQKHIGMELTGPLTKQLTRNEWITKQSRIRCNKDVKEAMKHFVLLSRITWILTDDNDEDCQGFKWYYPWTGKLKEELNIARILADKITTEIDEIHFEQYRELNNNATGINGIPNEMLETELPLIYGDRKQSDETKNKTEERLLSKKRNEGMSGFNINDTNCHQTFTINYIPWPFSESTERQMKNNKTDPHSN
jgi:hypothetical protein